MHVGVRARRCSIHFEKQCSVGSEFSVRVRAFDYILFIGLFCQDLRSFFGTSLWIILKPTRSSSVARHPSTSPWWSSSQRSRSEKVVRRLIRSSFARISQARIQIVAGLSAQRCKGHPQTLVEKILESVARCIEYRSGRNSYSFSSHAKSKLARIMYSKMYRRTRRDHSVVHRFSQKDKCVVIFVYVSDHPELDIRYSLSAHPSQSPEVAYKLTGERDFPTSCVSPIP